MTRVQLYLVFFGFACCVCAGVILYASQGRQAAMPLPTGIPEVLLHGKPLTIELAKTPSAREEGLSGRSGVPDNYGMLFIFPYPERLSFWMKGMLVPLDIFWLDSKGQVLFLAASVATSSYPAVLYPDVKAQYVLETQAGFGEAHGVAIGTVFELKNIPSVSE
jgi:uncharacterized membrane protein (UPF0127 family)